MGENHIKVTQGFRILLGGFTPYIARELQIEFGEDWWQKGVLDVLFDDQKRNLPERGEWADLVDSIDVANALRLFDLHWNTIFRKKLSLDHRTWAKELMGTRNKLAHLGGEDFSDDDTWRALDTMARLSEQIDAEGAEEIRDILRDYRYGSVRGSTAVTETATTPAAENGGKARKAGILETTPATGLPAWRDVIEPHPDVALGRYKNAEFAADLAQVARGEAAFEYQDPVEFFSRTYVTEGMLGLLEQAVRRVSGKDGEPVIQLKTAFGGGKTHSMLALYHLLRGQVSLDKLPSAKPVLERAGVTSIPRTRVAVLVGTALDPTKARRPQYMPGITINTLWGEMAAQLAQAAGDPKLYDFVKEADKKGVSPGHVALKELFDASGPCLILMDEIVAYAKKLYGASGLPAGTYDNLIAFIQEITEAARASKNSLVVASIPESDLEIGGEAGQKAVQAIEHTFGRMEAIWKPVAASEGFEIVRRRLFLDCKEPDQRDAVCARFSQMYAENPGDFPLEAREVTYHERMKACYPIHPEVFDRLYEDWATLERFQRTRGVLRLMAAVIHELWMANDASLMIMPGSIPLDVPVVRDELTRHLPEGWNPVVDHEVDGRKSVPYQVDQSSQRYGRGLVARRVARTIMLGSAPTVRDQSIRGIESSRIRLGCVQPGETIANFNDAQNTLRGKLAYLYSNSSGDRFWYDTRPTLRKMAEDRATQLPDSDVDYEIERRLRELRREQPFAGVHICPASSSDVPDEQSVRLVILRPNDGHKSNSLTSTALSKVIEILNNRGTAPRTFRNMLAFVAPDQELMSFLRQEVKRYLAWKSIKEDSEDLNLDTTQIRETQNNLYRVNRTVSDQIQEAYRWLLIPNIDKSVDLKTINWDIKNIAGGSDSIVLKAAKAMQQAGHLISAWAPLLLKMELDNLLWREQEHIQIKQLWDFLATYCYLPRLANEGVLMEAIQNGVKSAELFALAAGLEGERYIDLKFNQDVGIVERSGYLVKVDAAKRQIAAEAPQQVDQPGVSVYQPGSGGLPPNAGGGSDFQPPIAEPVITEKNTQFLMSAALDTTRIGRDVQKLVEEVIVHLTNSAGAQVEITLEVSATNPNGFSEQDIRTVNENCRTLKVKSFGFENDRRR